MAEKVGNNELVDKLKEEFDDHIKKVYEKNKDYKYSEFLTPENFEEEVIKTPAFLDRAPTQEEIDASPALSALQALKYEETDPLECALAHKEDGNHHFKAKKYQEAIIAYSEGLKQKFDDAELRVVLLTNRAIANFNLENHRSSLNDATSALKINKQHMKAIYRAAMCCFEMQLYDDCVQWCDESLQMDPTDKKILSLRQQSLNKKKLEERNNRKRAIDKRKVHQKQNALADAIQERGIKVEGSTSNGSALERLKAQSSSQPQEGKVYLDDNNQLHWPVYFLYPEYNQSDFIEDFCESSRFIDHLDVMFEPTNLPEWDEQRTYNKCNIKLFYEDRSTTSCVEVSPTRTLKEVLSDKRYLIRMGAPGFIILSTKSKFFQQFSKTVKME